MARLNEITSTEKLLDLIRKKNDEVPLDTLKDAVSVASASPLPFSFPRKIKVLPFKKGALHKSAVIGVDMGHEFLRFVKTTKGADGKQEIQDLRCVPIPSAIVRTSKDYTDFLKKELDSFCGANGKVKLWAIMSAAQVDVRHIRVPKVGKKQLESVVLWTVKKESPFNEKESLFDFEVLGEVVEQGIAKLSVMYYTAPREDIEETKKIFSRAGWPLTGLSITPFAVQNFFRAHWVTGHEAPAASLFIGNDFSRIDLYSRGNLVLTRGIKAGINSMTESLLEELNEQADSRGLREGESPLDKKKAREILYRLGHDSDSAAESMPYGFSNEEVWAMIVPALDRLNWQVERTFEHSTTNLGSEKVRKIFVSGAMNISERLVQYFGSQLGVESEIFNPLTTEPSHLSDKQAVSCNNQADEIGFAPALGIALSDNEHTPNFLFTYKDKERVASVKKINMAIFVVFIALVVLCGGVHFTLLRQVELGNKDLSRLENELAQYTPPVDQDLIHRAIAAVGQETRDTKAYAQKYAGLAVISELSHLASPEVRLVSVKIKLGSGGEKDKPEGKKGSSTAPETSSRKGTNEAAGSIELEGIVKGNKQTLGELLANYAMKLDNSPLFTGIDVKNTGEETFRKAALLHFAITAKLAGI